MLVTKKARRVAGGVGVESEKGEDMAAGGHVQLYVSVAIVMPPIMPLAVVRPAIVAIPTIVMALSVMPPAITMPIMVVPLPVVAFAVIGILDGLH